MLSKELSGKFACVSIPLHPGDKIRFEYSREFVHNRSGIKRRPTKSETPYMSAIDYINGTRLAPQAADT
jgi:hypothetical protein